VRDRPLRIPGGDHPGGAPLDRATRSCPRPRAAPRERGRCPRAAGTSPVASSGDHAASARPPTSGRRDGPVGPTGDETVVGSRPCTTQGRMARNCARRCPTAQGVLPLKIVLEIVSVRCVRSGPCPKCFRRFVRCPPRCSRLRPSRRERRRPPERRPRCVSQSGVLTSGPHGTLNLPKPAGRE